MIVKMAIQPIPDCLVDKNRQTRRKFHGNINGTTDNTALTVLSTSQTEGHERKPGSMPLIISQGVLADTTCESNAQCFLMMFDFLDSGVVLIVDVSGVMAAFIACSIMTLKTISTWMVWR